MLAKKYMVEEYEIGVKSQKNAKKLQIQNGSQSKKGGISKMTSKC